MRQSSRGYTLAKCTVYDESVDAEDEAKNNSEERPILQPARAAKWPITCKASLYIRDGTLELRARGVHQFKLTQAVRDCVFLCYWAQKRTFSWRYVRTQQVVVAQLRHQRDVASFREMLERAFSVASGTPWKRWVEHDERCAAGDAAHMALYECLSTNFSFPPFDSQRLNQVRLRELGWAVNSRISQHNLDLTAKRRLVTSTKRKVEQMAERLHRAHRVPVRDGHYVAPEQYDKLCEIGLFHSRLTVMEEILTYVSLQIFINFLTLFLCGLMINFINYLIKFYQFFDSFLCIVWCSTEVRAEHVKHGYSLRCSQPSLEDETLEAAMSTVRRIHDNILAAEKAYLLSEQELLAKMDAAERVLYTQRKQALVCPHRGGCGLDGLRSEELREWPAYSERHRQGYLDASYRQHQCATEEMCHRPYPQHWCHPKYSPDDAKMSALCWLVSSCGAECGPTALNGGFCSEFERFVTQRDAQNRVVGWGVRIGPGGWNHEISTGLRAPYDFFPDGHPLRGWSRFGRRQEQTPWQCPNRECCKHQGAVPLAAWRYACNGSIRGAPSRACGARKPYPTQPWYELYSRQRCSRGRGAGGGGGGGGDDEKKQSVPNAPRRAGRDEIARVMNARSWCEVYEFAPRQRVHVNSVEKRHRKLAVLVHPDLNPHDLTRARIAMRALNKYREQAKAYCEAQKYLQHG